MATASPTPMGSSHFGIRRPSSRNAYIPPPTRPQLTRANDAPAAQIHSHARNYSLNDSSDDELEVPVMKFSAATNALLNDPAPSVAPLQETKRTTPSPEILESFRGSVGVQGKTSPLDRGRAYSPYPRRVVRLSGTPSTLRNGASFSNSVQAYEDPAAQRVGSPLDLSTPAQVPRKVRIAVNSSGNHAKSGGSSGRSYGTNSGQRDNEGDGNSQEYPQTVARTNLASSQGSVSRYGASTIGRTRHGDDAALQSAMRVKRVGKGSFMSGPARRGRRRLADEERSPVEEQGDGLDEAGRERVPESQDSQAPDSQSPEDRIPSQESGANRPSVFTSAYRDYASGSPIGSKDILNSVLGSNSPPPPTLASAQAQAVTSRAAPKVVPSFKVPAPRVDLPSTHDQENEAPPTFKRNKQAPLLSMEKVVVRSEDIDIDELKIASPERRPLALRSQNTPRRPAPPPPPPKMSLLDAATSTAGAATASNAAGKRNRLKVNGKVFTRLDCIGRGGSSKVYRVMAENSRFFALKRVSLDDADENAVRGFKGEIDLLRKLESVDRVIRLYDYELNEEKGTLSVLMEMGELDMKKILELRMKSEASRLDIPFVRHYWKEMLECLLSIHEHSVVHSDLKPHNFVLVRGQLKLIDFGIANAIQTDETVNVHRETQIGTPNYMSPESLIDSNAKPPDSRGMLVQSEAKLMKLGKPSDIWSLGCILYQMVYGRAPFGHIANPMQRCQAIINFRYEIEYPSLGVGNTPVPASLIRTMQKCLNRDQHARPTAAELLDSRDPFLYPAEWDENTLPVSEELLGRILLSVAGKIREKEINGGEPVSEAELLSTWPKGYFERLRKNLRDGKVL